LTEIKNFSFYLAKLPQDTFIEHNKTTVVSLLFYSETPAANMRLAFPTLPEPSLGIPNHFILNSLLQYLCKCAQRHKSTIPKKMNILYVAIDPSHAHGNNLYGYGG
jgi:hypothetical protein